MSAQIPILFLGDAPSLSTGLARIGRDLATQLTRLPQYRVAYLGRGLGAHTGQGIADSRLPFMQYTYQPTVDSQWGARELPDVWRNWSGGERGVVFTVWDPSRLTWFGNPLPMGGEYEGLYRFLTSGEFERWGYFAVDAEGPGVNGALAPMLGDTFWGYDRIIAYSRFGQRVIQSSLGVTHGGSRVGIDWMPHGYNASVFQPRNRNEARMYMEMYTAPGMLGPDAPLVGCVMSNQPRKDWGLWARSMQLVAREVPNLVLWAHTDSIDRHWDLRMLLDTFGLAQRTIVTTDSPTDTEMSWRYSACDVTVLPSLGEGFGYPIVESQACFPPGTPVETPTGSIRIEELRVGDEVLTHKGRAKKVTALHLREETKRLITIKVNGSPDRVVCTDEHPFYVFRGNRLEWVDASDIAITDYLTYPIDQPSTAATELNFNQEGSVVVDGRVFAVGRNQTPTAFPMPHKGSMPERLLLDPDFARLLGYWIAEGWAGDRGDIAFTFGPDEWDLANDCADLCLRYVHERRPAVSLQNSSRRVSFAHAIFARFLTREFGSGALNKQLPYWLLTADLESVVGFLRGAWLGDGTTFVDRSRYTRSSYATVSEQLAFGIRRLLHRVGVTASIYRGHHPAGGFAPGNVCYQVRVTGRDAEILADILGMPVLSLGSKLTGKFSFTYEGFACYQVREVSSASARVPVHNIAVADDQTYQVWGGVAVHNCGVPAVHINYAAGAELVNDGRRLVDPETSVLDTRYCMLRPVIRPEDFAAAVEHALYAGYIRDSMVESAMHLRWTDLWPNVWEKWFIGAARQFESRNRR